MNDEDKFATIKELTNHRRFNDFKEIMNDDLSYYQTLLETATNMRDIISLQAKISRTRQVLHLFE